jgi:hypothetical protein
MIVALNFRELRHFSRLSLAAICVVVPAIVSGQETTTPTEPQSLSLNLTPTTSSYSLRLAAEQLDLEGDESRSRLNLGIVDRPAEETSTDASPSNGQLVLSLHADTGMREHFSPGVGLEFLDDLVVPSRRSTMTLHESSIADWHARTYEGGLVGAYGGGGGMIGAVSVVALARLIIRGWELYKLGKLPPGASIPLESTLTLVVRDIDGIAPGYISVLPLTDGWIGDALHTNCDDRGHCVVTGMPSASSTLLVRGQGGSVVRWDHALPEISVRLKPTGLLQIDPVKQSGACCPVVRVLDERSHAIVPIIRWVNRDREEWIRLPKMGLTINIPEGQYRVQTSESDEESYILAEVSADRVTRVEVAY